MVDAQKVIHYNTEIQLECLAESLNFLPIIMFGWFNPNRAGLLDVT